jgi:uncharacterized protein (TIGR02145 family)
MKKKNKITICSISLIGIFLMFPNSCKNKDDDSNPAIPVLTTDLVSNVTQTTATCGGNVTLQGSSSVISRGVCWSISQNPTISDVITTDGSGIGSFTSNITGLNANTTYYVSAYAINNTGPGYGSQVSFTTTGGAGGEPCSGQTTVTDSRDGQVYPTIQIGDQCWLQKNMNYQTGNSWCYANNPLHCDTYGRLYDWETALGICPSGWHLPSDAEWTVLTSFLGGDYIAGGKMKSSSGWNYNGNGTNSSGFTALPGGNEYRNGSFNGLKGRAYFWSSTEISSTNAWNRHLYSDSEGVSSGNYGKTHGFSVRCLKD